MNEDGCVDPVESRLEVIRYTGVPVVERNCVAACVAVEDERKIQRLLNVLYDEIEAIDPDVSLVDLNVTAIEIDEVVTCLPSFYTAPVYTIIKLY